MIEYPRYYGRFGIRDTTPRSWCKPAKPFRRPLFSKGFIDMVITLACYAGMISLFYAMVEELTK